MSDYCPYAWLIPWTEEGIAHRKANPIDLPPDALTIADKGKVVVHRGDSFRPWPKIVFVGIAADNRGVFDHYDENNRLQDITHENTLNYKLKG